MRKVIVKLAPVGPGDRNVGEDGSVDFVESIGEFVERGISIVRLKATDSDGRYVPDLSRFSRLAVWIRERAGVLIEVPSEAGVHVTPNQRVDPLLLNPELVSIMPGSTNDGEDVLYNPSEYVDFIVQYCANSALKPIFSVVNGGMVRRAVSLLRLYDSAYPPFLFSFVFGGEDFLSTDPRCLVFIRDVLPRESIWFATLKGDLTSFFVLFVASLGGNITVGREYNSSFDGVPVGSNIELLKKTESILKLAGYEIASVQEARSILLS